MAGKRVYISFATEDAAQCNLLAAALDAWEVTYTTTRPALSPGGQLLDAESAAIRDCAVFLRLCTDTTKRSESMRQDLRFFDALQAEDRSKHQREQRALVNIILDAGYQHEPFDTVTLFIDTANKTRAFWLDELARPLGVTTQARRLSRRSMLALGVAGAITLASGGVAGTLFVQNELAASAANADGKPVPFSDKTSGQARWVKDLSTYAVAKSGDLLPVPSPIIADVAVGDTVIYIALWNDLLALDVNDGHVLWEFHDFQATGKPFQSVDNLIATVSAILYADKDIIVLRVNESQLNATSDAHQGTTYISVFDTRNQKVLSRLAQVDDARSVTRVGDAIYGIARADTVDGTATVRAYAFDLHSGQVIWSTNSLGVVQGGGSAYAHGKFYLGISYQFLCLNTQDGKTVWNYSLSGKATSPPTVADGIVYFGTNDGYLYALDAQTGKLRWRYQTQHPIVAQPLVADRVVYIGDGNGFLWAFATSSGTLYWSIFAGDATNQIPGDDSVAIQTQPVLYKNLIAVVCGNVLTVINVLSNSPTKQAWRPYVISATEGTLTGPLVLNGLFIVGNDLAQVAAINP